MSSSFFIVKKPYSMRHIECTQVWRWERENHENQTITVQCSSNCIFKITNGIPALYEKKGAEINFDTHPQIWAKQQCKSLLLSKKGFSSGSHMREFNSSTGNQVSLSLIMPTITEIFQSYVWCNSNDTKYCWTGLIFV